MQALYWLIIDDGGGLVETAMGGIWRRKILITWAAEFIEETEVAVQLSLAEEEPGGFTYSLEPVG